MIEGILDHKNTEKNLIKNITERYHEIILKEISIPSLPWKDLPHFPTRKWISRLPQEQ